MVVTHKALQLKLRHYRDGSILDIRVLAVYRHAQGIAHVASDNLNANRRDLMIDGNSRPVFDAQGVRNFIIARDRVINPVFVGRDDIMSRVNDCVNLVNIRRQTQAMGNPAEGLMQLIQGAPGVGKSSLLRALEHHHIQRLKKASNDHKVIPIVISDTKGLSVDHVHQHLRDGLQTVMDRVGNGEVRAVLRSVLSLVRDVNILGLRLGAPPAETEPPHLPQNCTILLMIDEIQTVPGGPDDAGAHILQRLESGSNGQAVMPVLAGLGNSHQVLQELGLSRHGDDAVTYMKALTRADIDEAVRQFIERFGVTATDEIQEIWKRTLYRWSRGWPKHLQNGLAVLGSKLLESDGILDTVDVREAQRHAVAKRIDYYWTRFGEQQKHPALLGQVLAHMGRDPVSFETIEAGIRATMQMERWHDCPAPDWDGMLRRGLVDGILTPQRKILYECPIPSLRSFAVMQTGTPLHDIALSGNTTGMDHEFQGTDIDGCDAWGRTPLHIAAQEGWGGVIDNLLAAGATLETTDRWGRTPLHIAAHDNAEDGIEHLLTAGADVHATDRRGATPLHHAAAQDSAWAVARLLDAGASPQARTRFGQMSHDLAPDGSESRRLLDTTTSDTGPKESGM